MIRAAVLFLSAVYLSSQAAADGYDPLGVNVCIVEESYTSMLSDPPRIWPESWHPKSVRIFIQQYGDQSFYWNVKWVDDGEERIRSGTSANKFGYEDKEALGETLMIDARGKLFWSSLTFFPEEEGGHASDGAMMGHHAAQGQCFKAD